MTNAEAELIANFFGVVMVGCLAVAGVVATLFAVGWLAREAYKALGGGQ